MISFRLRFRSYQLRAWHERPRSGALASRFARSVLHELLEEPHQARAVLRFLGELGRRVDHADDPARIAQLVLREIDTQALVLEEEPLAPLVLRSAPREAPEVPRPPERTEEAFIAVEIVDPDGRPIPHVLVEIELPNGQTRRQRANEHGHLQLDGVPPGNCRVRFPHWDRSSWRVG